MGLRGEGVRVRGMGRRSDIHVRFVVTGIPIEYQEILNMVLSYSFSKVSALLDNFYEKKDGSFPLIEHVIFSAGSSLSSLYRFKLTKFPKARRDKGEGGRGD